MDEIVMHEREHQLHDIQLADIGVCEKSYALQFTAWSAVR